MHSMQGPYLGRRLCVMLVLGSLLCSCAEDNGIKPPALTVGEGHLAVPGGTIWYRVTGTQGGIPVILIHGGPGMSSYYLKPFEELGANRQVIRYDQLGGGKSDKITDTTMFTIGHFVQELDSLRAHLGLLKWHVLGHSWGTILALEYYRAHGDHVASIIFGSPVLDLPEYEKHARQLLTTLPDSMQQAVERAEASGKYDDPRYQNAMSQFYSLYVYRRPVPTDLDSTFATMNAGIYTFMQGPSEFTITGTLKAYVATSFLPEIKVPTLFTAGEFDEVGPELVRSFAVKVPKAKYVEFPGSAHMTPWDARDENVRVVRDFLRSADSLSSKVSD